MTCHDCGRPSYYFDATGKQCCWDHLPRPTAPTSPGRKGKEAEATQHVADHKTDELRNRMRDARRS